PRRLPTQRGEQRQSEPDGADQQQHDLLRQQRGHQGHQLRYLRGRRHKPGVDDRSEHDHQYWLYWHQSADGGLQQRFGLPQHRCPRQRHIQRRQRRRLSSGRRPLQRVHHQQRDHLRQHHHQRRQQRHLSEERGEQQLVQQPDGVHQ